VCVIFIENGVMSKLIILLSCSLFSISLAAQTRVTIQVNGMGCGYCVNGVSKKLKQSKDLQNIEVSLQEAEVTFEVKKGITPDIDAYRALITKAGYEPGAYSIGDTKTINGNDSNASPAIMKKNNSK